MNLVMLTGRLTKTPELRYTPNNTPVATFTVATNEGKTADGKDLTQFIPCIAWGKDAENINKFFPQGSPVILTGRVISESWEKDGEKRYKTSVRVTRWEFPQAKPKQAEPSTDRAYAEAPPEFRDLDEDGDLPF